MSNLRRTTPFLLSLSANVVIILVFVDDLLITSNNSSSINQLKKDLHQEFTFKDLGLIRYFLGIEVARSSSGTLLHQRKYILDILHDCGMNKCKDSPFPLPQGLKLAPDEGELVTDVEQYRRIYCWQIALP